MQYLCLVKYKINADCDTTLKGRRKLSSVFCNKNINKMFLFLFLALFIEVFSEINYNKESLRIHENNKGKLSVNSKVPDELRDFWFYRWLLSD